MIITMKLYMISDVICICILDEDNKNNIIKTNIMYHENKKSAK